MNKYVICLFIVASITLAGCSSSTNMFADDPEYRPPLRQYAIQAKPARTYLQPRYRSPAPVFTTGSLQPVQQRPLANNENYIVNYGDTLFSIFRRTGVNPRHLAQLNRLSYPYALRIGQVLRLQ